jgi:hypothetical protein
MYQCSGMFWCLPDPHPDPLVRSSTDPRIRIRICTKMSRIHNTALKWLPCIVPRKNYSKAVFWIRIGFNADFSVTKS